MVNPLDLFSGQSYIHKISTKTVLNPYLWALTPTFAISSAFIFLSSELWTKIFFVLQFLYLVFGFIGLFIYFALNDPGRLHSEEHIQKMERLSIERQKGKDEILSIDPLTLSGKNQITQSDQNDLPESS